MGSGHDHSEPSEFVTVVALTGPLDALQPTWESKLSSLRLVGPVRRSEKLFEGAVFDH